MELNQSKPTFVIFLRSTFLILVGTLLGLALGWFSATLQTAQWEATVKLDKPNVQQLGNYYALSSTYDLIKGENNRNIVDHVFNEFTLTITSPETLKEFLNQNDKVKKYASDQKQLVEAVLPEFIQAFQLNKFEITKEIHIQWSNPDIAKSLLTDYILFTIPKTQATLNSELVTKWKVLFQQVQLAVEKQLGPTHQASQDWNGKLNLMKAVQPLDEKILPFRLQKSTTLASKPIYLNQHIWSICGGFLGFLFALGLISFVRFGRKSA